MHMSTQTKILPRGLRNRVLLEREFKFDAGEIDKMISAINNKEKIIPADMGLQAATMHLEIALRHINKYNNKVTEKLINQN